MPNPADITLSDAVSEALAELERKHKEAADYVEANDVDGEWLAGGSWKDWESEAEAREAEARRDTLAEALQIVRRALGEEATT